MQLRNAKFRHHDGREVNYVAVVNKVRAPSFSAVISPPADHPSPVQPQLRRRRGAGSDSSLARRRCCSTAQVGDETAKLATGLTPEQVAFFRALARARSSTAAAAAAATAG